MIRVNPVAWVRTIELADAHLRMARNSTLQWGEHEDPEAAIEVLLDHGLFTHRIDSKRVLYLNGGTEAVTITVPQPDPDETGWDLVLEPGQAKILFREFLDGIFTPSKAYSIFSSERQILQVLELELDRIGYEYGDQDASQ